ncbi:MAG: hypothetical protein D6820_09990, partial [Lentisphaerae bacterium]
RKHYEWALKRAAADQERLPELEQRYRKNPKNRELKNQIREIRGTLDSQAYAAAALYRYTGESRYQDDLRRLCRVKTSEYPLIGFGAHPKTPKGESWNQEWAVWVYCLLDPNEKRYHGKVDIPLHERLTRAACNWADFRVVNPAQKRSFRNGYEWTMPHVTGQETTPYVLPAMVAWKLSGDAKYLACCYWAADYCLGGNPLNMCWVTQLGDRYPREVLHLDSQYDGIEEAVPGIVPYGPRREGDRGTPWFDGPWDNDCGRNTAYPYHKQWPIAELWFENRYNPQGNEFTCSQNIAPSTAVYGFLCAPASGKFAPNKRPLVRITKLSLKREGSTPSVTITAEAQDPDGTVAEIEIFADHLKIGSIPK